jgi:hypothetical protein
MDQKYRLPDRFHERVLEYEIQIERHKDNIPHGLLKGLTELYSVRPACVMGLSKRLSTMAT